MIPNDAALIIIDVQAGFLDPSWGPRNNPEAEARIGRLLAAWRDGNRPIRHIHHASRTPSAAFRAGTPGHLPLPEARPAPGEAIHIKQVNSAFIGTSLERDLRDAGIDTVVIVGLTTNHCVSTTARMAANLGFATYVVSDATAAFARPALDGVMRPAAEVHAAALSDLADEFATIVSADELLRAPDLAPSSDTPATVRDRVVARRQSADIPDSALARAITEFVRDTETPLLFNHSSRVYRFGALAGLRRALRFDRELLYAGAMFHDVGLMPTRASAHERFEVDGANAARDFLRTHGVPEPDIDTVWAAIALHTTPGVPQHMHPVVALVTAGVEMDVLGLGFSDFSAAERDDAVADFPRLPLFKERIIDAFYEGVRHKPDTTFGNVKADVIADKEPGFHRGDFCAVIRGSPWPD